MRVVVATCLTLGLSAGAALAQTSTPPAASAAPKAAVPAKPNSPATTPASPRDKEAARKVAKENIAECMRLWDSATHMTKQEWARTCERIQSRLENLRIENLDVMGTGMRKKGAKRQGSFNLPGVWNEA